VQKAEKRAKIEHPKTVFFNAVGALRGPTTDPSDISEWHLRFSGATGDFQYVYSPSGQYIATLPWVLPTGIRAVNRFSMTQGEAALLLREAGYTGPFDQLYLAEPVVRSPEPVYYFCLRDEDETVGVGTHTRTVFPDLFPC
jgi:hypothetical protein